MEEQSISSTPRSVLGVVRYIQKLISDGTLRPGGRLPAERELAKQLKMSRGSIRIGVGYLVGTGILEVRSGVGTFLTDGAPHGKSPSLQILSCIHHFNHAQTFEALATLEEMAAVLATERRGHEHIRNLAEELTEIYASVNCPDEFLMNELRFYHLVAVASGNPVLVVAMDMIAAVARASPPNEFMNRQQRQAAARRHREIYSSIREGCVVELKSPTLQDARINSHPLRYLAEQ
jgi:GntR family transcriptional repressor for pyruvate dehydrogenase complex